MPKQFSEDPAASCAFTHSDGRHCRMFRFTKTSKHCFRHVRKLRHLNEVEDTAFDLVNPIRGSFVSATALTRSLTLLFANLAEGRVNAKDAVAMAASPTLSSKPFLAPNRNFSTSTKTNIIPS
jgi:hypothetical protein